MQHYIVDLKLIACIQTSMRFTKTKILIKIELKKMMKHLKDMSYFSK